MIVFPSLAFLASITNTSTLVNATINNYGKVMTFPVNTYLMDIVSPSVLVLIIFLAVFYKDIRNRMTSEVKIISVILLGAVLPLTVASFIPVSVDPFRQALDLASVLALLVACLIGLFEWKIKNWGMVLVLILVIGFGLYHNIPTWFSYNSAISKADKEAIQYMNTLDITQYNCSPNVAYWIYEEICRCGI